MSWAVKKSIRTLAVQMGARSDPQRRRIVGQSALLAGWGTPERPLAERERRQQAPERE